MNIQLPVASLSESGVANTQSWQNLIYNCNYCTDTKWNVLIPFEKNDEDRTEFSITEEKF